MASLDQPTRTDEALLEYVSHWAGRLQPMELAQVISEASGPSHLAVFVVDLLSGFCHEGALQSDRVRAVVGPIVDLLVAANAAGVEQFVLTADSHRPDALEFTDFPVHCIAGTAEVNVVPELMALPFAHKFHVIRKSTISSSVDTGLDRWLRDHPEVTHRIVVGDCTDLCVYQLAMYLKLTANARNVPLPVIVPANCVDTYDVPTDLARDLGIPAHPGDAFHRLFLYHMALNGIRVVSRVALPPRR